MSTECETMHIDRANEIAVSSKPANSAYPISAFGLVMMPTAGTPARCSSFGASEARDAGSLGFVGKVVDVLAVFPQRHALIVMASAIPVAHAVWVAYEERSDLMLDAEVEHGPGRLVTDIANAPLTALAKSVLGSLQLLPAARVFLASALLFGKASQLLTSLPLERTDAAPGHNQGCARIGSDGGQMDFSQVYRCLSLPWGLLRPWNFDADMQFKAPVPHEGTRTSVFRKVERQHQRPSPSAHRQDHPPLLFADSLCRPMDGIEAFRAPGILHLHPRMLFAQFAGGLDVGEEGAEDRLNRLAMQGKPSFGEVVMQVVVGRPGSMSEPGRFVSFHAQVPSLRRFHLRLPQALEERR